MIIFVRSFPRHDTPCIDYSYFICSITSYWFFVRHICIECLRLNYDCKIHVSSILYRIFSLHSFFFSLSLLRISTSKSMFRLSEFIRNSNDDQNEKMIRCNQNCDDSDGVSVLSSWPTKNYEAKWFLYCVVHAAVTDHRWTMNAHFAKKNLITFKLADKQIYDNCTKSIFRMTIVAHCVGEWQTKCKYYPNHHMVFAEHVQNQGLLCDEWRYGQ